MTLMPSTMGLWLSRFLFVLAMVLLLAHLGIYIHYAVGLMQFPFDYDQGEGFELVDTGLFSEGKWPYRNNEVYPFYASNYPPLFHVMLVPCVWLFGEAYWYGRLAGFLGTLITAATISYVVYREERHRTIAVMAGLAVLASNYVYHVGPLFRQHMTMVMFETLSVAVLARVTTIEDVRRRRRVMLAGLLMLLAAGYTKQLALTTCVAVFGFLSIRNPRRSVAWGLLFGVAAGGLFLSIDLATGGEWWKNIIAANVNEYYPGQFMGLFEQWFRLHYVLIVMSGLYVLYELYFTRLSLYSVWWVLAVANTLLSGKWGAGDSYFATAIAASCLLTGLCAARLCAGCWELPPENPYSRVLETICAPLAPLKPVAVSAIRIVVPGLFVLYALTVVKMPTEGVLFGPLAEALGLESSYGDRYAFYDAAGWTEGYATIGHVPTQTDVDNGWRIVDIMRASERPVLSEEAGFSIRAGKDVVTNPTQLKNLYENDLFDPTNLLAAIQDQAFGLAVFRAQFYPPPVVAAMFDAYYPAEVIKMNGFNYEIWRPGPSREQRAAFKANLAAVADGETVSQSLDLSFDETAQWLEHMLKHQGWQRIGTGDTPETCKTWDYGRGDDRLQISFCAIEPGEPEYGSQLTLTP